MESSQQPQKNLPPALENFSNVYSTSYYDKIYNVVKVHHYQESLDNNFTVNTKTNSIILNHPGTNQSYFSQKVQRTFLLDSISVQDSISEDILVSVIRRIVENENSFILSVNRGMKKSSRLWNKHFLETLTTWLYQYLDICEERRALKYSVRISALEIDEENDKIIDQGQGNCNESCEQNDFWSFDNSFCRRCNDVNTALGFFNELEKGFDSKDDKIRKHVLYVFHLYQQTNLKSLSCTVSSKCSKIFLLQLDLTKYRNLQNSMSLPLVSKFIISHLNKDTKRTRIENNFQKLFSEIFQQNIACHSFIIQISGKEKNLSDSYQLLQLSGRIQRLKIKFKKNWNVCHSESGFIGQCNNHMRMGKYNFKKSGKFSDSEITSNSEISCAETVICLREEKRRNSDDESFMSRRLRSVFISSDSDSGCKDLRLSQSSYSRDGTPVNFIKRKSHPRTNALAWPKSAIRMAKTAILTGQEMWVDGPNVYEKSETVSDKKNYSFSTISTPETVKQVLGAIGESTKAIMISQETQYEYQKVSSNDLKPDFHQLADISEITDEIDTVKYHESFAELNEIHYNSLNSPFTQVNRQFSDDHNLNNHLSSKNDVIKVSQWINDVSQLTSNQITLSKSYPEPFLSPNNVQSINSHLNNNINHNYQYYDLESQDDYGTYPRLYSPVKQTFPTVKKDSKQISYINDDEQKNTLISDKKLFNRYKKKESSNDIKDISKLRCFISKSPLGLLKKTLFQSKSAKKKMNIPELSNETNNNLVNCQEIRYLVPISNNNEDSSDSSSDSECNQWFRNMKTFKNRLEATVGKPNTLRPPSAPLPAGSHLTSNSLHPTRQRSSSSGYGSVITKDSEISSHLDSNSDQSIHSFSKPPIKQSISFTHTRGHGSVPCELSPDVIAERNANLVKQEKAILLMQHQELMIGDFYKTTRPLLTNDDTKYVLRMSTVNYDRLFFDNQYLDELEEDTNIIRDSIAFYKSLIHLESSFLGSPKLHRKLLN